MKTRTRRDLTIVSGFGGDCLVIACDSCGGIGEKPGDSCKLPAYCAGKFTARVVLYEILCAGSEPVVLADGLACEMKPTGAEIIRGIREELHNAGMEDLTLTGSTEENFCTSMTAIGMTAVGIAREEALRFHKALPGDQLMLFGRPAVGAEVELESAGLYREIRFLLALPDVREIVPAGSRGIAYEAHLLASLNGMTFEPFETDTDLSKSAGPATCVLALCGKSAAERVTADFPEARIIGTVH